jgi:hypothetical protein
MRPTWHFVHPADIRWLLALTAPRVNALNAYYYRKLELDEALFSRCNELMTNALRDGNYLMRSELALVLQNAGIAANGMRLGYIVHRAELDGVVCSGPRRGKQFTYALLDERAPQAVTLEHDEALGELIIRYFSSHGPATIQDFAWWSGLTVTDTRLGIDIVKSRLLSEVIDGQAYWFAESLPIHSIPRPWPTAHLLPNYDEYTVAYTDRSAIYDLENDQYRDSEGNFVFNHTMVLDGRVVGSWKRTFRRGAVMMAFAPFTPLTEVEKQAIVDEADRFSQFLEMPVEVVWQNGPLQLQNGKSVQ